MKTYQNDTQLDVQLNTEELNSNIANRPSQAIAPTVLKIFWYFSFVLIFPVIIHFLILKKLKKLRAEIDIASGGIDTQLYLRSAIIIKMYENIFNYVKYEKDLYDNVLVLKNFVKTHEIKYSSDRENLSSISNMIFKRLLKTRDLFPELKINRTFLELAQQSTNIEREVVAERNNYNMYVTIFNEKIFTFPTIVVANFCELWTIPLFQGNETDRRDISVKF